jgi:hypothetical protein
MFATIAIAASLLFTDPTVKPPTSLQTQAEELTFIYIYCESYLPESAWRDFRPLAELLGVTDEFVSEARHYISKTTPPPGLNRTLCTTVIVQQGTALLEAVRQRQESL